MSHLGWHLEVFYGLLKIEKLSVAKFCQKNQHIAFFHYLSPNPIDLQEFFRVKHISIVHNFLRIEPWLLVAFHRLVLLLWFHLQLQHAFAEQILLTFLRLMSAIQLWFCFISLELMLFEVVVIFDAVDDIININERRITRVIIFSALEVQHFAFTEFKADFGLQ